MQANLLTLVGAFVLWFFTSSYVLAGQPGCTSTNAQSVTFPLCSNNQCGLTSNQTIRRVNSNYECCPYGNYRLVVNRNWALDDSPEDLLPDPSIDGRAQVSGTNEVGAKERIGFADPTILYLDGWYYIPASLSGGPIQSGPNFDMLKSRNLIDWVVHARGMLNSDVEGRINCREFSAMGSPQLYIDPAVPNSIRLLFNATENPCYPDNSDACNASQINVRTCANQSTWTIEGNVEFATTPMVTSIAVASFLASPPGHFGESQPAEPWRFTYRWNGNAVSPPDGGWTAGVPVPCSVNYCASANGCCNSFTTPPVR